jgi:uncharacterized membrane protein SirB2
MNLLILAGGLAALFGLWTVICKLDGISSLPHAIAAVLMMFGVVMLIGFGLGAKSISPAWLVNGIGALLFGIAIWLAFDRRKPWEKT